MSLSFTEFTTYRRKAALFVFVFSCQSFPQRRGALTEDEFVYVAAVDFRSSQQAYEVLGDPEKRRSYDAYGHAGMAAAASAAPAGGMGGWASPHQANAHQWVREGQA